MTRGLLIAAFLLSLCLPASSQFNGCPAGFCPLFQQASGGGYTGIGDIANIPTPIMAFGAHCFKNSYAGSVIDVFDNASSSVKATLNCTNGVIGVTAGSTWTLSQVKSNCTGTHDCYATRIYDQSGALACTGGTACDISGLTTANGPYLVTADGSSTCGSGSTFANSGTFCLQTNTGGTVNMITAALTSSISQPITYLLTYATLSVGTQADIMYNSGSTVRVLSDISATQFNAFAGGSIASISGVAEAQWHAAMSTFNGASSFTKVDTIASSSTNTGTGTIASGNTIGLCDNTAASSNQFFGFIGDFYVFSGTSISTASTAVVSNEAAWWGGGIP